MEIIELPIDQISPDPNQPRTVFDEDNLKNMAASIRTEGVINAIEIDGNNIIITGESRWRSARMAGLTTVPCKVITVTPEVRFRRQVIENIHQNSMTAFDTAKALAKMLNWIPGRQLEQGKDAGVRKLADELGKSKDWILQHLALLEESDEGLEYIKHPDAKYSYIREINSKAPEEIKDRLKRKVYAGEIKNRDTINEVIRAVKRDPEKTDDILNETYTGAAHEDIHKIQQISPPVTVEKKEIETTRPAGNEFYQSFIDLLHLYEKIGKSVDSMDIEANREQLQAILDNTKQFEAFLAAFRIKIEAVLG